ncbi:hypothetical protein COLO4_36731, partial [Corchorus olitorius]
MRGRNYGSFGRGRGRGSSFSGRSPSQNVFSQRLHSHNQDWRSSFFSVHVNFLSLNTTISDLWKKFSAFGRVADVFLSNRGRQDYVGNYTFAFVRFRFEAEMNNAIIRGDGTFMDGRRIRVSRALLHQASFPKSNIGSHYPISNWGDLRQNIDSIVSDKNKGFAERGTPNLNFDAKVSNTAQNKSNPKRSGDNQGLAENRPEVFTLFPKIPKEDMTWIERSAVGFLSSFISHQS